jgi:predicted chitinase
VKHCLSLRSSAANVLMLVLFACSAEVGDVGPNTGSMTGGSTGSSTGTGSPTGATSGSGSTGSASSTTGGLGPVGAGGAGGSSGDAGLTGSGGVRVDGSAGAGGSARPPDAARVDGAGGSAQPPDAGPGGPCGLTTVVTQTLFDTIFPLNTRNALYTYEGFVAAAAAFPTFVNTGTLDTCRKEAAAFLANVARETGRLRYAEQIAKAQYCASRNGCVCDPATQDQTRWYYGRGALQLSWNYNYCAAGAALGLDLLTQPNLVSTNSEVAWKTALWFWMSQRGAGTATCHAAITSGASFGETIRTINGGQECNLGGYGVVDGVTERVDHYIDYATRLGIANPGLPQDLDC